MASCGVTVVGQPISTTKIQFNYEYVLEAPGRPVDLYQAFLWFFVNSWSVHEHRGH